MKKSSCLFLIVIIALLSSISGYGSGFHGTVYERNDDGSIGSPIAGATVKFVKEDYSTILSVTTTAGGHYSATLPLGRYRVMGTHDDYEDYSSIPGFFVVNQSGFATGNIFLKRPAVTTVFLVRHAEKQSPPEPDDTTTPLTTQGKARAKQLKYFLWKAGVTHIHATEFLRTQQTVAGLADALALDVDLYSSSDAAPLINDILDTEKGDTILVAAHSNTVPLIIQQLHPTATVCNVEDFDNIYMITFTDTKSNVLNLQYGADSTPDTASMSDLSMKTVLLARNVPSGTQGAALAEKLSFTVHKGDVTRIYHDGSSLSEDTVEPLSDTLAFSPQTYDPGDCDALITAIVYSKIYGAVTVAGEIAAIESILGGFRALPVLAVDHSARNDLFVITRYQTNRSKVVNLSYCVVKSIPVFIPMEMK